MPLWASQYKTPKPQNPNRWLFILNKIEKRFIQLALPILWSQLRAHLLVALGIIYPSDPNCDLKASISGRERCSSEGSHLHSYSPKLSSSVCTTTNRSPSQVKFSPVSFLEPCLHQRALTAPTI